jgi:hypothetical protein
VTATSEAARAFDAFLDASAPAVAAVARALRLSVLAVAPDAEETFDPADRLLAFGPGGSRRAFWLAIIRHTAHVNLQLADGAQLADPDERIEGTGKRIRHVEVSSIDDAGAPWLRAVIERQVTFRSGVG